jgi:hypothetical protein
MHQFLKMFWRLKSTNPQLNQILKDQFHMGFAQGILVGALCATTVALIVTAVNKN